MSARATPRPYADPYLAGVGLGLVLLASFVLAGRGLGASGAFATAAATSVQAVAPGAIAGNPYLADHLAEFGNADGLPIISSDVRQHPVTLQ